MIVADSLIFMAFILSAQDNQNDIDAGRKQWQAYQRYLQDNQAAFPKGAYELATSDWYYDFEDHRAPHDAWLESVKFEEVASGERSEVRHLSLRIRLFAAYHDRFLEFFYPVVYAYSLSANDVHQGHADWLCDEFRLSDGGHLIHEIEWAGGKGLATRWLIEASDVRLDFFARSDG